ncbi:GGDEF domain-containing protein [Xanthomonas rydalmerensis]|uniref:diguanylate cyclase n=1 Tax=Xanthomonas rydalmerensis TaxID=3046274 RepID=A0ABZ0JQX8_9XANT|nr:GGDEF domain-containing protein [Xanthomonas sp. DM-2023]WOS42221.1 GGDEF domain-containing protein [Xanthomonas sp. DM-2023]WOS46407.1 GGDEF domain-containing protein [Xanthomonas sp. DM-2023]WOS50586.1 GGDEF domain-containing protein [Xanthomonas sp. DM-2023]WOS54766.1 GGDEF domain-containing protein [Xanthomonas sp. DM-2023]WOS58949.1 GGDEF domain-containing protein [Xanthomonas sp. DM-2023]
MHPELEAILSHSRDLPSPPGIALRIIELAQDADVDLAATADAIAMDMALSARMLRIANSPLYASRRRIDNLGQALTMLGLNAALSLALGFSMVQSLRGDASAPQERLWRRSVLAALASRLLGQAVGLRKHEELMLAGLLQDMGALALLHVCHDQYAALLHEAAGDPQRLSALEREHLGADHAEVGAWLAKKWKLPAYLQRSIANGNDAAASEPFDICVRLSGPIADIWLSEDTEAARTYAMQRAYRDLQLDSRRFDEVIGHIAEALPAVSPIFDVRIAQPERVDAIISHARELMVLRNLRDVQEANRVRQRADEYEQHARRLAEQASRDALTGVFNRHQLDTLLQQQFELANRHDWPLSVAFIDLDDFKKINDAHGHLVGDQVLRAFAQALQPLVRSSDIVARFGGEEFLVLLPNTGEDAALGVMRRILSEIAQRPMTETKQGPLRISFSAGVATQGGRERFNSAQELLQAADDMLYSAKHGGRNRVTARSCGEVQR